MIDDEHSTGKLSLADWANGYAAYWDGAKLSDNPFGPSKHPRSRYIAWRSGWENGKRTHHNHGNLRRGEWYE